MKTSKFGKIFAILVVLIGTLTEHTVPVYAAEEEKTTDGSLSTMSKQFLEIHQDDFDMESWTIRSFLKVKLSGVEINMFKKASSVGKMIQFFIPEKECSKNLVSMITNLGKLGKENVFDDVLSEVCKVEQECLKTVASKLHETMTKKATADATGDVFGQQVPLKALVSDVPLIHEYLCQAHEVMWEE